MEIVWIKNIFLIVLNLVFFINTDQGLALEKGQLRALNP
jgi:hypothetical protein